VRVCWLPDGRCDLLGSGTIRTPSGHGGLSGFLPYRLKASLWAAAYGGRPWTATTRRGPGNRSPLHATGTTAQGSSRTATARAINPAYHAMWQ
jgi:hypothetical protein